MKFLTFFSYSGELPRLELELLDTFKRSILSVYPQSILTIITDPNTAKKLEDIGYATFSVDVSRNSLLLDRVKGLQAYVAEMHVGEQCIMLDFDMLLLKRFDFLEHPFDAAYTIRAQLGRQPVNGGFAVYRNNARSLDLLKAIINEYELLPQRERSWWGDQLSLSKIMKESIETLIPGDHQVAGARVRLLDAKIYNFTPYDMDVRPETLIRNFFVRGTLEEWIDEDISEKYLLHFKGPRKHLQFQVSWQERMCASYLSHLTNTLKGILEDRTNDEILRTLQTFSSTGPMFMANDLIVLLLLNWPHFERSCGKKFKAHLIETLTTSGDFRAKLLTGTSYNVTQL